MRKKECVDVSRCCACQCKSSCKIMLFGQKEFGIERKKGKRAKLLSFFFLLLLCFFFDPFPRTHACKVMLKREKALFFSHFFIKQTKNQKKEKVIVTRRTKRLAQKTTSNKRAKQKKMSFFHFQEMVTQTPNPKDANLFFSVFFFHMRTWKEKNTKKRE